MTQEQETQPYKFQTTMSFQGQQYIEGETYNLTPELAALFAGVTIPRNTTAAPAKVTGAAAPSLNGTNTDGDNEQSISLDPDSSPREPSLSAPVDPATDPDGPPRKPSLSPPVDPAPDPEPSEASVTEGQGTLEESDIAELSSPEFAINGRLNLDAKAITISDIAVLSSIGASTARTILKIRPEAGFQDIETFKALCAASSLNRIEWEKVENEVDFVSN